MQRPLLVPWSLVIITFASLQLTMVAERAQTLEQAAVEVLVLLGVVGAAAVGGQAIRRHRYVRAAGAVLILLILDLGTTLLIPLRDRPLMLVSWDFLFDLLKVALVVLLLWPWLRPWLEKQRTSS